MNNLIEKKYLFEAFSNLCWHQQKCSIHVQYHVKTFSNWASSISQQYQISHNLKICTKFDKYLYAVLINSIFLYVWLCSCREPKYFQERYFPDCSNIKRYKVFCIDYHKIFKIFEVFLQISAKKTLAKRKVLKHKKLINLKSFIKIW